MLNKNVNIIILKFLTVALVLAIGLLLPLTVSAEETLDPVTQPESISSNKSTNTGEDSNRSSSNETPDMEPVLFDEQTAAELSTINLDAEQSSTERIVLEETTNDVFVLLPDPLSSSGEPENEPAPSTQNFDEAEKTDQTEQTNKGLSEQAEDVEVITSAETGAEGDDPDIQADAPEEEITAYIPDDEEFTESAGEPPAVNNSGPGNSYIAELTEGDVIVGTETEHEFSLKFTEVGSQTLGSARFDFSVSSFTDYSLIGDTGDGVDLTDSQGRNWYAEMFTGYFALTASGPDAYLTQGESVSVVFRATTPDSVGIYQLGTTEAWTDNSGVDSATIIDDNPENKNFKAAYYSDPTVWVAGEELIVGSEPGDNYSTISSAITGAADYDLVTVRPGTYNERLDVTKPLYIRSETAVDQPTIDGGGAGNVVTISTDDIFLKGFTIQGAGSEGYGILADGYSNSNIIDNNLINNYIGIALHNFTGSTVTGNTVTDNLEDNGHTGIELFNVTDSIVRDNTVSGYDYGMHYRYSGSPDYSANNLSENEIEIRYLIEDNILTAVLLEKDENNDDNWVALSTEDPNPMPNPYDEIVPLRIQYDFELPAEHPYRNGAYFDFSLADVFQVFSVVSGDLRDDLSIKYGTYLLDRERNVRLEFNEVIENNEFEIPGWVRFETRFRDDLEGDLDQDIPIAIILDEQEITVPISFQPRSGFPSISKDGTPNRVYNAEDITWTVDFNKDLQTIESAVLEDPISSQLDLLRDSIKLYRLTVQVDGSVVREEEPIDNSGDNYYVIELIDETDPDSDFQLRFIEDQISEAYRLIFTTDIKEEAEDETLFENLATLRGLLEGTPINFSDNATVTVTRGTPLAKGSLPGASGYNPATQTVTWEIRANYNKKTLDEGQAVISDAFGDNQVLVDDSFSVYEVEIDDDTGAVLGETLLVADTDYSLAPRDGSYANGFVLTFLDGTDQAHRVEYQTTAVERILSDTSFTNTVSFNTFDETASRNISQMVLSKSNSGANYDDKTVNWTIDVNRDRYEMTAIEIDDLFTNEGLLVDIAAIRIQIADDDGVYSNYDPANYTITAQDDGFTINFNEIVDIPVRITYTTGFTYEDLGDFTELVGSGRYFENQAVLTWNELPIGEDPLTVLSRFTPDLYTRNNGFKDGDYNANDKEITWTIGLNYNLRELTGARVTDSISGDHLLIEESIAVYNATLPGGANRMIISGDALIPGEDYNLVISEGGDSFEIEFIGEINSPYIVQYTTSLEDQVIVDQYSNDAYLDYLSDPDRVRIAEWDYTVNIPYGGSYTGKTGTQREDERIIDWEILINPGQSALDDVSITDYMSAGQLFLAETLNLFRTLVSSDGSSIEKTGDPLIQDIDYILTIDGLDEDDNPYTFRLEFVESIETAYLLEFQSFFTVGFEESVSNNVSLLAVQQTDPSNTGSDDSVVAFFTDGSGGIGSRSLGTLIINKVDDYDNPITDNPALFDLLYQAGEDLFFIGSGSTDNDGILQFSDLSYGYYVLREIQAPDRYLIFDPDTNLTINSETLTDDIKEVDIRNFFISAALTKTDDFDQSILLPGAVFNLLDADGNLLAEGLRTDDRGRIEIAGREPGTYRFIETEAPAHYQLDQTPLEFEISFMPTETNELFARNSLIPGYLELTKVNSRDGEPLSGAVFRLEYLEGAGSVLFDSLISDEDGLIRVDNLRPGRYRLVETAAPTGYALPRNNSTEVVIGFSIDESGDLQEIEIGNRRRSFSGGIVTRPPTFNDDLFAVLPTSLIFDPDDPLTDPDRAADSRLALPQTSGHIQYIIIAVALLGLLFGLLMMVKISQKPDLKN